MEKKTTIADRINELLTYSEVKANPEMVEFLNDRLAKLEAKKNAPRQPSKVGIENEALAEALVAEMEQGVVYSLAEVTAILKTVTGKEVLSTSKATAIVTKARNAGKVVREEVKGKASYHLA